MFRFNAVIKLLNTVNKNGRSLRPLAASNEKRRYKAPEDPFQGFIDEDLRNWYSCGKHGIDFLTILLKTIWRGQPTVQQQVLLKLRFYASGSFLQVSDDTRYVHLIPSNI